MQGLDRINIPYGIPQGGQFIFADISRLEMGSLAFCEWILENTQVLLYPGATYGADFDNSLRITFLQNESKLAEAMSRISSCSRERDWFEPRLTVSCLQGFDQLITHVIDIIVG